jgi:hypothetical protein
MALHKIRDRAIVGQGECAVDQGLVHDHVRGLFRFDVGFRQRDDPRQLLLDRTAMLLGMRHQAATFMRELGDLAPGRFHARSVGGRLSRLRALAGSALAGSAGFGAVMASFGAGMTGRTVGDIATSVCSTGAQETITSARYPQENAGSSHKA